MEVDGTHLFYSPAFVAELSDAEVLAVWVHEILHVSLLHHTRRGSRDPSRWNEACDFAVNPQVKAAGFTLPKGALLDARFAGMSAEQIYAAREAERGQDGGKSGQDGQGAGASAGAGGKPQPGAGQPQAGPARDPGRCGGVRDAAASDAGKAEAAQRAEKAVRQAVAVQASGAGKLAGAGAAILAELNAPRVPWFEVLARFIDDAATRQLDWNRPNRRFLGTGFALPSTRPDSVSQVAVWCDTSGSTVRQVSAFGSEIAGMLDTGRVERVHVAHCDAKVRATQDFEAGDACELKPAGGGGTRADVALEHIARVCPDAACIVALTDLDIPRGAWGADPGIPVLWIVTGKRTACPFGEVVHLDAHAR